MSTEREAAASEHPSQEGRVRHGGDMRLRAQGFEIIARPCKGENEWVRGRDTDGKPLNKFTETEANNLCDRLEQEAKKK